MEDPFNEINIFYTEYIQYSKSVSEYYENNKNGKKINPNKLNGSYQNLAFVTLKEDFYSLLKNLFADNINFGKKYYPEMITKLLNLIKKLKNKDEQKKDQFSNNSFKYLFANEFLVNLIEDSPKNIVSCAKSSLMEYIKSPQIFNVNQRELHGRKIIISKITDYYSDILSDLIHEMNNDKNTIFSKISDEEKKKILRRVSFVIYSCQKDKFSKNFELIKSTAKELLSDYSSNSTLQVEIFLIMRMLFLRFSHDGVMQMIRDLWPIIFTELVQNIEDKKRSQDPNLLSESFKFVELLSLANIEEFSLYQWIFMLDTYDINDLDIRKEESLLSILMKRDKHKIFRPLSLEAFPNKDIDDLENLLKSENKGKSELYIKSKKPDSLKQQIRQFFYAIGDMNSYKVDVNYEQIENNIENDFLEKEAQKKKEK